VRRQWRRWRRCLAKDPSKRYQGGRELRAALEAIQTGAAVAPAPRWPATGARRLWLVAAALLVAVAVTSLVLDVGGLRQRLAGGGPAARIASIAVLPLENLSGDPDQDYLAEGMHEALITELAQLSGLERVIGRASVARFRGSTQSLGEIARELKVGALITGAVQRSGDRVRVTAHLIDPATEAELWTRSYERALRDVLSLQDEIVGAITREVGIQLTAQEQARLTTARPVNPEAYEAYLKGSYHWKKLTPAGVEVAQTYCESALAKDRRTAQAHEGLGVGLGSPPADGSMPSEAGLRAKAEALEAIRLDEGSAASHEVLAALRTWIDWDWAGADTEWRRALELNPNSANSHGYYAHFLAHTGRTDEAIPHAERALGLDR
jgi:TolB-like protein